MPTQFTVKVVQVGNSLRVAIPKPAAQGLGLEKGSELKLTVTDHKIVLEKA